MTKLLAKLLARPAVAEWLIRRAMRTPYTHLDGYMMRYWLFNPYFSDTKLRCFKWCPISIRIHHILRADDARHPHDHPWNARTFILKGGYIEQRDGVQYFRLPGSTAAIGFGEYHHISYIQPGGAWTVFVTWRYQGTWGFLVNGKKVPYKEYLK